MMRGGEKTEATHITSWRRADGQGIPVLSVHAPCTTAACAAGAKRRVKNCGLSTAVKALAERSLNTVRK